MTNTLAIWIGIVIAAFFAVDAVLFDWTYTLFLGLKLADLLWWLSFWRSGP
ncbi:MAG: hypothetical protein JKY00_00705 [Roseicyclus sp.]|nr:hypothetical protein [Roseicyclus sp.]